MAKGPRIAQSEILDTDLKIKGPIPNGTADVINVSSAEKLTKGPRIAQPETPTRKAPSAQSMGLANSRQAHRLGDKGPSMHDTADVIDDNKASLCEKGDKRAENGTIGYLDKESPVFGACLWLARAKHTGLTIKGQLGMRLRTLCSHIMRKR